MIAMLRTSSRTGLPAGSAGGGMGARAALQGDERARARAGRAREGLAPVPAGVERIRPGWLRAALEGEPTSLLLALTDGLPAEVVSLARDIVAGRGEDPQPQALALV